MIVVDLYKTLYEPSRMVAQVGLYGAAVAHYLSYLPPPNCSSSPALGAYMCCRSGGPASADDGGSYPLLLANAVPRRVGGAQSRALQKKKKSVRRPSASADGNISLIPFLLLIFGMTVFFLFF